MTVMCTVCGKWMFFCPTHTSMPMSRAETNESKRNESNVHVNAQRLCRVCYSICFEHVRVCLGPCMLEVCINGPTELAGTCSVERKNDLFATRIDGRLKLRNGIGAVGVLRKAAERVPVHMCIVSVCLCVCKVFQCVNATAAAMAMAMATDIMGVCVNSSTQHSRS